MRQKEAHRHVEHERVFAQQVDAAEAEHLNRLWKPGRAIDPVGSSLEGTAIYVFNIPLLKLKECEGIVYRGMVLVSTDAAAVKGDDDVNVVRYHVLLSY